MMKITNLIKYASPRALLTLAAAWMLLPGFTKEAKAQVSCEVKNGKGMQPVSMNLSNSLTSSNNIAGKTFSYTTKSPGGGFRIECSGPDSSVVWTNINSTVNASSTGTEGPWTYYKVDEYFSMGFSWSDCSGTWYLPVRPFNGFCGWMWTVKSLREDNAKPGNEGDWVGRVETNWTVRLRVERAFSGPRAINFPNMFR
ncbi:hypothetical protein RM352_004607, partial [Enterobacter kobei]|nr:hypothetical protein [Enterobacter kobei]